MRSFRFLNTVSEGVQMKLFLEKEESHQPFIFESRSIMSSSPAVTFHQPACQAHSVQCAAKDSLSCVSVCVKGLVVVSVFLIRSMRRMGKHYYGPARKKNHKILHLICFECKQIALLNNVNLPKLSTKQGCLMWR